MAKLKNYEFSEQRWPPPKEKQNKDLYLFGFDEMNQPYIVKWENLPGRQGWCACTLQDGSLNPKVTADIAYLDVAETNKTMRFWAEAPLLKYVERRYS